LGFSEEETEDLGIDGVVLLGVRNGVDGGMTSHWGY